MLSRWAPGRGVMSMSRWCQANAVGMAELVSVSTLSLEGVSAEKAPRAERWPLPGKPHGSVGTRHHLLPQLHQRYFGNERGMIAVVDRVTGKRHVAPISDAIVEKDFYTSIDNDGAFDGRSDHLLTWIEGNVAPVMERIVRLGLFQRFPLQPVDVGNICLFLAFQITRGRAARRMAELMGDTYMHIMVPKDMDEDQAVAWLRTGGHEPTTETIAQVRAISEIVDDIEFVPDPNAHIGTMGRVALSLFEELICRPLYLAVYDEPSLLTCDEPVVLYFDEGRPLGHRAGVALADQIWFPMSPRHLLILGRGDRYGPPRRLDADPASVDYVNLRIAANAYESILMHPDQDHLAGIELPPPGPLYTVNAPGFPALERHNHAPQRRRTQRRRR